MNNIAGKRVIVSKMANSGFASNIFHKLISVVIFLVKANTG